MQLLINIIADMPYSPTETIQQNWNKPPNCLLVSNSQKLNLLFYSLENFLWW